MGTLQTIVTRALVQVRGQNQHLHAQEDTQVLGIVNSILEDVNKELQSIDSNLVYANGDITLSDGTAEYTPSFTAEGFMDDGVWIEDSDGNEYSPLVQLFEDDKLAYDYADANAEGQPEGYYITEDNKVGFLPVPDATYTAHCMYWKPLTELTTMASDDLPFRGLWNRYIQERLVVELMLIQERDVAQRAAIVNAAYDQALSQTYRRGVRRWQGVSSFFRVEGV